MSFDPFPRPYRDLILTGWTIEAGAVVKEGVALVVDIDDPGGRVSITDNTLIDCLFPTFVETEEDMLLVAMCFAVLSSRMCGRRSTREP